MYVCGLCMPAYVCVCIHVYTYVLCLQQRQLSSRTDVMPEWEPIQGFVPHVVKPLRMDGGLHEDVHLVLLPAADLALD